MFKQRTCQCLIYQKILFCSDLIATTSHAGNCEHQLVGKMLIYFSIFLEYLLYLFSKVGVEKLILLI